MVSKLKLPPPDMVLAGRPRLGSGKWQSTCARWSHTHSKARMCNLGKPPIVQMARAARGAYYQLQVICQLLLSLENRGFARLTYSLVTSSLDYCKRCHMGHSKEFQMLLLIC